MIKKFQVSDFDYLIKFDQFEGEEKAFLTRMAGTMCGIVNKAFEGFLSPEEVEQKFKELNDKLKEKGEKYADLVKDNEELVDQVKKLGDSFEKLKQSGFTPKAQDNFDKAFDSMYDSPKFKNFLAGQTKMSGKFSGFTIKDVSLTNNYEGSVLLSRQENTLVNQYKNKGVHMRDVVTHMDGDPEHTVLVYPQVTSIDRNARFETENGRLKESSFSVEEKTEDTKRVGTWLRLSKRMLKSRVYVRSFILNMLPAAISQAEDFGMLFGDGKGEHLLGIAQHPNMKSIEGILSTAMVSGAGGSVKSVATYNGGKDTLVEFTDEQPKILDGTTITFTGALRNTPLNSPHELVKLNDRQIVVLGAKFTASESSTAEMTFKVTEAGFKSIETPNSGDAIRTAAAVLSYAQFSPTLLVLNPMTINAIESEKDTTGRPLGLVTIQNGVKYISGLPVFEFASMAPGKYLIGDFDLGAKLVDYTSLTLEWIEDLECKLANQVALVASEELIFPIYMPFAFAYGSLAELMRAITKE